MAKGKKPTNVLKLTPAEKKVVNDSFTQIRAVLKRRRINIENVIGLVTSREVEETAKQVEIRFAEKTAINVVMNMVNFD
jgi:hypothetical protein